MNKLLELLERFVLSIESIAESLVVTRLLDQRGGEGTPAHTASALAVDRVIARKIDAKQVQAELEKLERADLVKELQKLGAKADKRWSDKRLVKELHEALMAKKEQDNVYGTDTTATEEVAKNAEKTASVEEPPVAPESKKAENSTPAPPVEAPSKDPAPPVEAPTSKPAGDGKGDEEAKIKDESVAFDVVVDACKNYVASVYKDDVKKGQAVIIGIMHKHNPDAKKFGDLTDEQLQALYKEVLDL